jgi:hypothetical protein
METATWQVKWQAAPAGGVKTQPRWVPHSPHLQQQQRAHRTSKRKLGSIRDHDYYR